MKRILVYSDFTEDDLNTMEYATNLAETLNHAITIFHSVDLSLYKENMGHYGGYVPMPYHTFEKEQKTIIRNKYKEWLKDKPDSIKQKTKLVLEEGKHIQLFIEEAKKDEINMALMTGIARKDIYNRLLGENYMSVIETISKPVWIIPPDYAFKKINTIIYATDLNKSDLNSLKKINTLAENIKASIIVLHVKEEGTFEDELKVKGFFKEIKENLDTQHMQFKTVSGKSVADEISAFSQQETSELIAIMKENKNFLESLFEKSTTKKLFIKVKNQLLHLVNKKTYNIMQNDKRKILLPIDFIIDSEHLLDYAIQLALELDFDIYMLHVSDPEQSEVYYTQGIQPEVTFTNIQSRLNEAKKAMKKLKDDAQKKV